MKKPEQAERTVRRRGHARASAYHRYLKRAARRLMRHLGKTLRDDAPRKIPLRGYEF